MKKFYRNFILKLKYNTEVHYYLKYFALQYKNEIKQLISVKEDARHPHGNILTKVCLVTTKINKLHSKRRKFQCPVAISERYALGTSSNNGTSKLKDTATYYFQCI